MRKHFLARRTFPEWRQSFLEKELFPQNLPILKFGNVLRSRDFADSKKPLPLDHLYFGRTQIACKVGLHLKRIVLKNIIYLQVWNIIKWCVVS